MDSRVQQLTTDYCRLAEQTLLLARPSVSLIGQWKRLFQLKQRGSVL